MVDQPRICANKLRYARAVGESNGCCAGRGVQIFHAEPRMDNNPASPGEWRPGAERYSWDRASIYSSETAFQAWRRVRNLPRWLVILIRVTESPFDKIHTAERYGELTFGDATFDLGYFIVVEWQVERELRNGPFNSNGFPFACCAFLRCGFLLC